MWRFSRLPDGLPAPARDSFRIHAKEAEEHEPMARGRSHPMGLKFRRSWADMMTSGCTARFMALTFLLASLLGAPPLAAQDWPEFRGPTGQGHSDAVDLPLTWSEAENVLWKVPFPDRDGPRPSYETARSG